MPRKHKRDEDDTYCPSEEETIPPIIISSDDICNNPLCDHRSPSRRELKRLKRTEQPKITIKTIDDLIDLGKTYHCKQNTKYYDIDLQILSNLVPALTDLKRLVGMTDVKDNIINHIVFFLQGYNEKNNCGTCTDCIYGFTCNQQTQPDMLHTVITGPPGVGKTELGKVLGKIYKAMGILSRGHMNIIKRNDLVGKYLGHTAAKTQKCIDSCIGGVMFIDEGYQLGDKENRDSFSKECIDTLNQNMTEQRDLLVIIAGYEESLNRCFFSMNEGLHRRFSFRYDIPGYSPTELFEIFIQKINNEYWFTEFPDMNDQDHIAKRGRVLEFFKQNKDYFPNHGGDMETLFLNCKIVHARRTLHATVKRILTEDDIKKGFDLFFKHRKIKEPPMSESAMRMYL